MKLPRLQLHLSTCIVLMFVAGGLLWANFASRDLVIQNTAEESVVIGAEWGWPNIICQDIPVVFDDNPEAYQGPPRHPLSLKKWRDGNIVHNSFTALALLAATAVLCEWLLRRRKPLDAAHSAAYSEHAKREDSAP